jgi:hypothetical protein
MGQDASGRALDDSVVQFMQQQTKAEELSKKVRYYQDAFDFVTILQDAIPVASQLLASKVKSDVVLAIQFFVEAERSGLSGAKVHYIFCIYVVGSRYNGNISYKDWSFKDVASDLDKRHGRQ